MEYKEKVIIPSSTEVVIHFVSICIKCANDDINISEYEDRYGFISTATCKACKNEVKLNGGKSVVIKAWNKQNDIPTLILDKTELIAKTKDEIKGLKILQRARRKTKTPIK